MKSGFTDKWLEDLKSRINIVDVIGGYTQLTRRGKNHWACCPFHSEKTPSFAINEAEQYYHCFGCGAGGDVIRFVMEVENESFYEAVKQLAEKAGLPLPEITEDENVIAHKKKISRMSEMMKEAGKYYYYNLATPEGKRGLDYWKSRGLSKATIMKFGLGVSLGYTDIVDYLLDKGYSEELMKDAGIVNFSKGKYFDHLTNRVIVPIFNQYGEVIAFGGRELEKSGYGKYQNTTQTELFDKSKTLFGLNLLRKYKQATHCNWAIMVEGYMDVISLVQGGIENVVASMGTSLTQTQARLIKRYVDKVYICYDGDAAGQTATLRGLDILRSENIEVMVITIPDDLDPDDYIKKYGKEGYMKLVEEAKPLIEYKLYLAEQGLDKSDPKSRAKYAEKALAVLKEIPSELEREAYLPSISKVSGFVIDLLKNNLNKGTFEDSATMVAIKSDMLPKVEKGKDAVYYTPARFCLYCIIHGLDYTLGDESLVPYLEDDTHRDILRYVDECRTNGEKLVVGNIFSAIDDEKELEDILSVPFDEEQHEINKKYYISCVTALKKRYLERLKSQLNQKIKEETDVAKRKEYIMQLSELIKRK